MSGNDSQSIKLDYKFIESIINGMFDWVRVLDRDDNVLFVNKAMAEGLGQNPTGQKCYSAIGRTSPCENCISRKTVFEGTPHEKEEIINGQIFSVMSSPIRNENDNVIAVVEVLRNITQTRYLQNQLMKKNSALLDDLNMAKKLQCSLLPKKLQEDKIKFSFIYKPCEALGGDFLDIYMIDSSHLGVYIADVSGHGVPASMLTVFLRSSINKKTLSPAKALKELYREFNSSSFDPDFYITVFYAVINLETQEVLFSNAGHNVSPIIFGKDRFELLRVPGIPISNWLEEPVYEDRSSRLSKGDRLFLYTDGIIEMKNQLNIQYGEERLLEILLSDYSEPSGTLSHILDSACRFAGINDTTSIPDDITMVLLEMN
ncbi:MAG: SpoIIE family protein phosphatase [Clostridia bacterium]|nr:SpoIIE family protein phosphatase [Clostridia bacterium]